MSVLIIHWHCFQVSYARAQLAKDINLHQKELDYFPKKYPVYANNWLVVTDSSESRNGERHGSSCRMPYLRGSLPKSGPLDFATKNTFPLFFVGEEALVGIY